MKHSKEAIINALQIFTWCSHATNVAGVIFAMLVLSSYALSSWPWIMFWGIILIWCSLFKYTLKGFISRAKEELNDYR